MTGATRYFEDFVVGEVIELGTYPAVTEEEIICFARRWDARCGPTSSCATSGTRLSSPWWRGGSSTATRPAGRVSYPLGRVRGMGAVSAPGGPPGDGWGPLACAAVQVEVIRSARRRKTVQARRVNGVVRVSIPATMTRAEEEHWVAEMVRRLERSVRTGAVDLVERAARLADRHGLPLPASIRWVDNQDLRWGSCTPTDGTIRISSRLASEPEWVLDYVIVHELAHLVVTGHGRRFWALVSRYPRTERARGWLMARAAGPSPPDDGESRTANSWG